MSESAFPYLRGAAYQQQDQDTQVPNHHRNYDFAPDFTHFQWASNYHAVQPRFHYPPGPELHRHGFAGQAHYQHPGGFPTGAYMGDPGTGFQYGPTETMPNSPPPSYHPDLSSFPWLEGEHNRHESFNGRSMPMLSHPSIDLPNYMVPPIHPHWTQPPPQYSFPGANGSPHQYGVPSTRRMSHQRSFRQGVQETSSQQRRHTLRTMSGSTPLPDLSSSARNSNRRSFDRYSTDLSNNASDWAAPVRSPGSRSTDRPARRPRANSNVLRARFLEHPNVPSPMQMQVLRDRLRHFLPKELPEGIGTMCDICQKDYSTKHVDPSEDEEIAIQLPCKHVFGEQCINTWFDTCKKQKLKITCPMCRKLLIEPLPMSFSRANGHASSRAFLDGLQRFRREDFGQQLLDDDNDMVRAPGDQGGGAVASNPVTGRLDGA